MWEIKRFRLTLFRFFFSSQATARIATAPGSPSSSGRSPSSTTSLPWTHCSRIVRSWRSRPGRKAIRKRSWNNCKSRPNLGSWCSCSTGRIGLSASNRNTGCDYFTYKLLLWFLELLLAVQWRTGIRQFLLQIAVIRISLELTVVRLSEHLI